MRIDYKNLYERIQTKKYIFEFIIPMLIITGVCFWMRNCGMESHREMGLRILGDEYGYWTAGAWLNGWNWSEIASYNNYYGYGYGIILAPILLTGFSASVKYKIALGVNYIFLLIIYVIIMRLLKKICPEMHGGLHVVIALATVLYSDNIFFSQYSMTETLILLMYWLAAYLTYSLLTSYSVKNIVSFVLLMAYGMSVHQRLIGLFFCGSVFLIYIFAKNKKRLHGIMAFIGLFGLIAVVILVKKYYTANYLMGLNGNIVNDFAGQTSKLSIFFSVSGIKLFFESLVGKIYYAAASTFGFFLVAVIAFCYCLIKDIKAGKISKEVFCMLFLLLVFFITAVIEIIFFGDYSNRFELLIYGRYLSGILDVLIFIGLVFLAKIAENKKYILEMYAGVICAFEILSIYVETIIPYGAAKLNLFFVCPGIQDLLERDNGSILLVNIKVLCIVTGIIILVAGENKQIINKKVFSWGVVLAVAFAGITWIETGIYTYKGRAGLAFADKEVELSDRIRAQGMENSLYYYLPDSHNRIERLQFLLGNATIHCIKNVSDINTVPDDAYIITVASSGVKEELEQRQYVKVDESIQFEVWEKRE